MEHPYVEPYVWVQMRQQALRDEREQDRLAALCRQRSGLFGRLRAALVDLSVNIREMHGARSAQRRHGRV